MTVNDDSENYSDKEISDDTYWKTYFEDETISMDTYKERLRLARKHGNKQKQQTTERLDKAKEEPSGPIIEFIYDR